MLVSEAGQTLYFFLTFTSRLHVRQHRARRRSHSADAEMSYNTRQPPRPWTAVQPLGSSPWTQAPWTAVSEEGSETQSAPPTPSVRTHISVRPLVTVKHASLRRTDQLVSSTKTEAFLESTGFLTLEMHTLSDRFTG